MNHWSTINFDGTNVQAFPRGVVWVNGPQLRINKALYLVPDAKYRWAIPPTTDRNDPWQPVDNQIQIAFQVDQHDLRAIIHNFKDTNQLNPEITDSSGHGVHYLGLEIKDCAGHVVYSLAKGPAIPVFIKYPESDTWDNWFRNYGYPKSIRMGGFGPGTIPTQCQLQIVATFPLQQFFADPVPGIPTLDPGLYTLHAYLDSDKRIGAYTVFEIKAWDPKKLGELYTY
ncbi:MAG: hypothetical protein V2A77_02415 [Pseudomonadota bacterium]